MRKEILDLYLQGTSPKKISKIFAISFKEVIKVLDSYVKEDVLVKVDAIRYRSVKVGELILKKEGYGFIKVEGAENDFYVPKGNSKDAVDGDKVKFYAYPDKRRLENAEVLEVLERKTKYICGRVIQKRKRGTTRSYVITKDEGILHMLRLDDINEYPEGTMVKVEIKYHDTFIGCKVVQVLGNDDDAGIEITLIAAEYGFKPEFSDEVIRELETLSDTVEDKYLVGRTDYQNKTIITIDGDDAKDFDDAVSLEKLENENYLLGVYIADVANYVLPKTILNEEALERGTSVYLADRVIPMLPFKLSNSLCSLQEGVIRLVLACVMEINSRGKIVQHTIEEGYIKSSHRMTYNNVNKILAGDQTLCDTYQDIVPMIQDMDELAKILRENRHQAGGLDFEVDEHKIILDAKGVPTDIALRSRGDAEKLIEDFMLTANGCVSYHLASLNLPCVYRVHEKPDQEKIHNVFKIMNSLGVNVKEPRNEIHAKLIQTSLEYLTDNPLKPVINQLVLRAMMKAKYTTKNMGHYGLAMEYYSHFTSPIRRYPDLILHRIIKELIIHPENFDKKFAYYENELESIAIQNSNSERKAIDCEREVMDMLTAWYMMKHVNEKFSGIIVGVMNFGLFVALNNGAEGMVSVRDMDGYFNFDDKLQVLSDGERSYSLGDKVNVIVTYASKEKAKVELVLEEDYHSYFGEEENENYQFK